MSTTSTKVDETKRNNSLRAQIPSIQASEFGLAVDQLEAPSLASTLKLPDDSPPYLSPTNPTNPLNKSLHTLSLKDLLATTGAGLDSFGPEAASAEVNVAADESFIETSSGPLVREMKRRFDQFAGVSATRRSPYVITAYVSQHGKSLFRLGFREESAPTAVVNAVVIEPEDQMAPSNIASDASHSPRTKRRSRLSMHLVPPAMFTRNNSSQPPARPPTTTSSGPRKLQRRTRSIPDLVSAALEDKADKSGSSAPTFAATGRGHSQSVTAADMPRNILNFQTPADRKSEAFARLMGWQSAPLKTTTISARASLMPKPKTTRDRQTTLEPFGPKVAFSTPSRDDTADGLKASKKLRPMQSFESGLTARQDDLEGSPEPELEPEHELTRPPSAIRLSQMSTISEASDPEAPELSPQPSEVDENISPESLQLSSSHYSTEVFNVLQTYRGLPDFESFMPEVGSSVTNVIRLSLTTETSAAPRDDPRFVLWGEVPSAHDVDDHRSTSRDSLTDQSSSIPSSTMSRRRSSKVSRMKSPESSSARLSLPLPSPTPPPEPPQRVLLAATIERWLAQLTSDLNYDELLNFFLTYRAYVSAVDLCHLFICRFHWALQKSKSPEDQTVRRIVRVRTFVALRYWMVTFFTVDFIPNRELRLLISDWLNTLLHDPVLHKHMDGIGIVRRLIKVAKDCKKAHTKAADKPKPVSPPRPTSRLPERGSDHLFGQSFANAVRREADEESDLDLDFLPDEANAETSVIGFPSDPANAHLSVAGVLPAARPTSLPLTNMNILQRTDHSPGYLLDSETRLQTLPVPIRHSAISRAFVKTIGRLGRWKRALNSRPSGPKPAPVTSPGVGISAFDLEINASGDFLRSTGGVEDYLKTPASARPTSNSSSLNRTVARPPPSSVPPVPPLPAALVSTQSPSTQSTTLTPPSASTSSPNSSKVAAKHPLPPSPESPLATHSSLLPESAIASTQSTASTLPSLPPSPPTDPAALVDHSDVSSLEPISLPTSQASFMDEVEMLGSPERTESLRSSSTDSFGEPLRKDGLQPPTFPGANSSWQFDVVSIDDLDFSDTSSFVDPDPISPPGLPGLRKPTRKLPMRRDFEFVRRSEVSSMGIISQDSLRDSISSIGSTPDGPSPTSSVGVGTHGIQRWQMKSLQRTFEDMSTHSDDKGDVEAALRRLEGQINPSKVQENEEKVNGWVKNLQERMAKGDYEYSIYSEDEVEGFIDEIDSSPADTRSTSPSGQVISAMDDDEEQFEMSPHTPMPGQTEYQLPPPPGLEIPVYEESRPALDEAVPLEILQSRMQVASTENLANSSAPTAQTNLNNALRPRIHRSFILSYTAGQLAEHFSMIDRELFMTVKFEELIAGEWADNDDSEILDWAQYLKDRARWKVESRMAHKTTALAALRTRFNLMVAFVNAEVILTPPIERWTVVNKFIRIAWACYELFNLHTMTAIIFALNSDWVQIAMRKSWHRLGMLEARMLSDLTRYSVPGSDFGFMRDTIDAIADAKQPDSSSRTPSIISGGTSDSQGKLKAAPSVPACIPFIGIYLSQLHRLNKLPAVIDPTSPNNWVGIDPVTADFDPLAHPEVFSNLQKLPPSIKLEPLINVHKQRQIADVIKSLVAGQHLASRIQFNVDRKLFQRCLRLRGLEPAALQLLLEDQNQS